MCEYFLLFLEENSWSSILKRIFRYPVRIQCSFPVFSPQDIVPPRGLYICSDGGIFSAWCHSCVATVAVNHSLLRLSASNHSFKLSIHLCHRSQKWALQKFFFFFFWLSNRNDENMHTVESDHIFQVWFIADSCPKNFSLEPASPFLSAAAAETVWRGDVNSRQASYLAFLPCQMHQRQEITQLAKIYHTVSPKVKTGFSYSKANAVFCHR